MTFRNVLLNYLFHIHVHAIVQTVIVIGLVDFVLECKPSHFDLDIVFLSLSFGEESIDERVVSIL